jgi:hypothetical protein
MATSYYRYGKIVINGKKKIVYRKLKSTKNYVKCKGKMMGLVRYKKMLSKKVMKGGNGCSTKVASYTDNSMSNIQGIPFCRTKTGGKNKKLNKK